VLPGGPDFPPLHADTAIPANSLHALGTKQTFGRWQTTRVCTEIFTKRCWVSCFCVNCLSEEREQGRRCSALYEDGYFICAHSDVLEHVHYVGGLVQKKNLEHITNLI
jgi:hypothetical protein